jgi:Arc/MetJ-type ribon-helix-helix transcriptional regulator
MLGNEMASDTERVTVRIPIETVDALQHLVQNGDYSTLSDAVRAAIDIFIEAQFAPEYIKKMTIELPKGNVVCENTSGDGSRRRWRISSKKGS